MRKRRLPRSLRKFIRQEKARIRREILGPKEAEEKIRQVVADMYRRYTRIELKK